MIMRVYLSLSLHVQLYLRRLCRKPQKLFERPYEYTCVSLSLSTCVCLSLSTCAAISTAPISKGEQSILSAHMRQLMYIERELMYIERGIWPTRSWVLSDKHGVYSLNNLQISSTLNAYF